jgi:hypothetical protein
MCQGVYICTYFIRPVWGSRLDEVIPFWPAFPGKNMRRFFDWLPVTKSIIGMHIILVRVIHGIQNSCIKCSTQNRHFSEMFTYSDKSEFLLFYCLNLFAISFIRQLFICVWCQWWPRWNFRVLSTAPSFDETAGICAIVAVVDTRRVLRARETTARGVYSRSAHRGTTLGCVPVIGQSGWSCIRNGH